MGERPFNRDKTKLWIEFVTNSHKCPEAVWDSQNTRRRGKRVLWGLCSDPASEGQWGGPVVGASSSVRDAKVDTGTQVSGERIA